MLKAVLEEIAKNEKPFLVYDRKGQLGLTLVYELSQDTPCVFVSSTIHEKLPNTISIHLTKNIPAIPDFIYEAFFLHYHGDQSVIDFLQMFANKADSDNTHLYFIMNIREASIGLISQISNISPRVTVLITGDIFHNTTDWQNPVTDLIRLVKTGRIYLDHAMLKVYPTELTDVITAIKRISKLRGIPGHKTLYLLPPFAVTLLSVARAFCKREPLLKLDFDPSKDMGENIYQPKDYTSVFGPTYSFSGKLPTIKISKISQTEKPVKKRKVKFKLPISRFLVSLLTVLMFVVFGLPVVSAFIGAGYLNRAQAYLLRGEIEKTSSSVKSAKAFFTLADRSMGGINSLTYIGLGSQVEDIRGGMRAGKSAADALGFGVEGLMSFRKVFLAASSDPAEDLKTGINNFKQMAIQVSLLQAEGNIPQDLSKYADKLENINNKLSLVYDFLPQLMGMEGKKKYIVLFQNNMELRPGGGFIGSFGILNIDKGKIAEFVIHDVYDADGQLSEHYEPPFQLRRYLGVSHWFLRDSNFDVDFPKNGAAAAFFYNAEMKDTVDGVIAVDTEFLRKLLKVLGSLPVIGYSETVTEENFFLLAESYAQDNFFPGSRQKQDFLKAVTLSLFNRFSLEKNLPYLVLAEVFTESISEKHLLFAFPDKNIQQAFSLGGMSSSLNDNREEKDGAFNDFLGINEANLGMNKVNYYLDRAVNHSIDLTADGKVTETVSVTHHNKSKDTDKYGGVYKAYIRFILPSGAKLQSVMFDGLAQVIIPAVSDPVLFTASGFIPEAGLEVESTESEGKTIYGFLHTSNQGTKKTITITYTLQTKLVSASPVESYNLRVFKQPGTKEDPYSLSLTYPSGVKILNMSKTLKTTGNSVNAITALAEDREFEVSFGKR